MHGIVEELQRIVTDGAAMAVSVQPDLADLLNWMDRRERVFNQVGCAVAHLAEDERAAVRAMIEKILPLDASVIAALEAQMSTLGQAIGAQQKLKAFIGGGNSAKASSMERLV